MINARGWAVIGALTLLAAGLNQSRAEPRHQGLGRANCVVVREFVAMVGAEKAEQMAREAGQSEARISAGRKCLKPNDK